MTLLDGLDPAAESAMRQLIGGAVRTQAVYAIAKLGIPDQLALGPRSATDLAERAGAHAETLRRVLRYLVVCGVFVEHEDGRFSLAPAGEYLQTAHPRSMRPSAIRAGEGFWRAAEGLLEKVRTGAAAQGFFDELNDAAFAARMSGSVQGLAEAIASHEALAGGTTLVDVGGGDGALLAAIVERRPHVHGILFDREPMIAEARRRIGERCELVAGDFFDSVPSADVALLSWVLHDWDDARAVAIVKACRAQTLLIAEVVLPERAVPLDATGLVADPYTLDLQMLLLTGGKERTLAEYRTLLAEGGYELVSAEPLSSSRGASLLTARRVG